MKGTDWERKQIQIPGGGGGGGIIGIDVCSPEGQMEGWKQTMVKERK